MNDTDEEHAQIGALLARCDYIELSKQDDDRWCAELQFGTIHLWEGYGKTQTEAIRAAVEAAEQGVTSSTNEPN